MKPIQRVTTLLVLLLTIAASALAQNEAKKDQYDDEMRKGDMLATRKQFEQALQSYKKAYSLSDKTSIDAVYGMCTAYRGLGAHKNVLQLCEDALKLAADDKRQQAKVLNLKGAALVGLAEKPNDKKYDEAVQSFRAALEANPDLHTAQLNLGVTLLKQGHDEEGIKELKTYVDRAPKGPETDTALKMIEEPRRAREMFAPAFSFTTKDGEYLTSDDLKGKVVVLDFWGTWCKPCVMATPGLVKLNKKFAEQGVVFVGVAVNDREEAWSEYIEKNKMTWPQFLDKTRKVVMPFAVNSYPTYIVIDSEGIVRARRSGYGTETDSWLESEIKQALKRK